MARSGPDLARPRITPPDPALKRGRRFLVRYVGVMGQHSTRPATRRDLAKTA